MQGGSGRTGCQNGAVPGRGQIDRASGRFEFLIDNVLKKKTLKNKEPRGTADPRTQTEAVPERAQIHRASGRFEIFDHVLAAQVPTGSIVTSVASRPHTPSPEGLLPVSGVRRP